jgi:hypothetical protein
MNVEHTHARPILQQQRRTLHRAADARLVAGDAKKGEGIVSKRETKLSEVNITYNIYIVINISYMYTHICLRYNPPSYPLIQRDLPRLLDILCMIGRYA